MVPQTQRLITFLKCTDSSFNHINMHADLPGQRFDQLTKIIDEIKNNPDIKRISLYVKADLMLTEVERDACFL